jgi:Zn-dependent oligopeptidase
MDAMSMFVNFRGREPVITPLLKNRGLIQGTEGKN